jgi:hypothetical protein
LFPLGALCIAVVAQSAFGQARHDADARASASLSEIAGQPKSLAVEGSPQQREVYEPERAVRRRNSVRAVPASPRQADTAPVRTTSTPIPSFAGFLGLGDNFTAIPPDTQGAVGPNHVVTILNTQVLIQSRNGAAQANFPETSATRLTLVFSTTSPPTAGSPARR